MPHLRPGFRPHPGAVTLSAIFGLNFGISIQASLPILNTGGYFIDGIHNNELYLRNVFQANFYWEDAIIRFNNYQQMTNVSLYNRTFGYDTGRYNQLYRYLSDSYGPPVQTGGNGFNMSYTWVDYSRRHYITLAYGPMDSFDYGQQYYTILTYGI